MFVSGKCRHYSDTLNSMLMIAIIAILVHSTKSDEVNNDTLSALDKLRLQLFVNYDRNSQPTFNGSPTNISLSISVNYIDIDEMNGKMTLHSWVHLVWRDEKRTWSPHEYNNITSMHFKTKEVWRPDISLFNSAGEGASYVGDTQVMLVDDGAFIWVPPATYTAYCSFNFAEWPYDTQICKVKIGSWTLTQIDGRYDKMEHAIDYSDQVESTEWEIVKGEAKYFEKNYYNYVEFTFEIKRRSSMYGAVIFTPATCLVFLALSVFWLPPQMGEKIMINGIIIVIIAAFLMYFSQLLPILAENTPLIVHFYSVCLLLTSISTIVSVCVLYLSTAQHKRRVPEYLKTLLNGRLGTVLFLTNFTLEADSSSLLNNGTKELGEHVYDFPETTESSANAVSINPPEAPSQRSIQFDWILLATAIDRIFFVIYSIVFALMAICSI